MSDKPLFFISHKHSDKKTADAVRSWVEHWSQKRVAVFQSSAKGEGLHIGEDLNDELLDRLHRASVVFLIYTTNDYNWSYCMWECGVSMNNQTRVVVLQCARDLPRPFSDKVNVELHSDESVHDFVRDFLTLPGFFRDEDAIAPHFEKTDIEQAAEAFMTSVRPTQPDFEWQGGSGEWPALPFLCLEMPLEKAYCIESAEPPEKQVQLCREALEKSCIVRQIDWVAASIFGFAQVTNERPFALYLKRWREETSVANDDWLSIMARQMAKAICGGWPPYEWKIMAAANRKLYFPTISWFRRMPFDQCIQFDFYFLPMEQAPEDDAIRLDIPRN